MTAAASNEPTRIRAESLLAQARALIADSEEYPDLARRTRALAGIDATLEALGTTATDGPVAIAETERAAADAGRIGFLSTVCHDLKDPLAAVVMGSSFLLRETKNAPEGDRVQRMVQAINRAGTRMGALLQNLTDFVHLSTGRRTFDLRDHPLRPIVDRVVEKTRAQAETAGVRMVIDIAPDLRVSCDGDAIALALEHLLSNAFRYSPHGADIRIDAEPEPGNAGERTLRLRVHDSGAGVPAERLPHVFDTYWNARQKARDGVGLGLGIVSAIALAHAGNARVESSARGTSAGFSIHQI